MRYNININKYKQQVEKCVQQLQEDFSSVETILRKDGEVTVITESGFAFKMSVLNYNDLIRTDEQKKKKITLT